MQFPLDEVVLLDLSNIHKGTKCKKVADKVKCIQMLSQSIKRDFIANILSITPKTVTIWKQQFEQSKDVISYVQNEHKGSKGYLDDSKKNC